MDSVVRFLIRMQADGGNVLAVARQATARLDEVAARASRTGARLRQAFSLSNFKDSLMSVPGMEFLTNPYTMMAAGIGAVAKLGAQAEQTATAFTVLVGNGDKARGMLAEIGKLAAETPFGKLDLVSNAQKMLNFGVATDRVLPLLRQLGDISGGDKERLSSLSLVLGQVSASGKLMGQDLLQFINAGFNPLQELSAMTGKTYKELQDMMSNGQVTFESVAAAMAHATGEGGKFNGMMERTSQTVLGKWSTLADNARESMAAMFTEIRSPLSSLLDAANAALPTVFGWVQRLFGVLAAGINLVVRYRTEVAALAGVLATAWAAGKVYAAVLMACHFWQVAVTVATKAWTAAQWLLNVALNANPIGIVIAAVAALTAAVVYCWGRFAGFRAFVLTVWDTLKGFGEVIKTFVIDRFRELLGGLGKLGQALGKLFDRDFPGAAKSAAEGVSMLMGGGAGAKAVASAGRVASGISGNYQRRFASERAKDKGKGAAPKAAISQPGLKGSVASAVPFGAAEEKSKGGRKGRRAAEEMATGGTRNTSVTVNISKFFDQINVTMADREDTAELERTVLQCLNRALAIATSTDR